MNQITYEGAVGITLRRWIERNERARLAVREVFRGGGFTFENGGGGYDVALRDGWCVPEGSGIIHGIVAATVADVIADLKDLQRCDCDQCQRAAVPAKKNPAAVALGRRGGRVKSIAKTEAVRANGMLGGRPRKAAR